MKRTKIETGYSGQVVAPHQTWSSRR